MRWIENLVNQPEVGARCWIYYEDLAYNDQLLLQIVSALTR